MLRVTKRGLIVSGILISGLVALAFPERPALSQSRGSCGELITIRSHDNSQTKFTLANLTDSAKAVLVLLPGGPGFMNLDVNGCPQKLGGNSLVWSIKQFHEMEMATVLLDAPTNYHGENGLADFRIAPEHAADIGEVISAIRARTKLKIWLAGTSRGSISAANAGSRLKGAKAPDGLVLTSPLTKGGQSARKAWVAHSVFSVPVENIALPILVIAHEEDKCTRTPPSLAKTILEKTNGAREQSVLVTGGPGWKGEIGTKACRAKSPHGFVRQRKKVNKGIVRFINGGRF